MNIKNQIESNLNEIKHNISQVSTNKNSPQIIAVSKTHSVEMITAAYQCGIRAFAENYVKELEQKVNTIELDGVEWHFIGKIQSNKIRIIAHNIAWVHSLTSINHANLLDKHRNGIITPLQVLIEVNISGEASKGGLREFEQILELAKQIQTLPNLKLRGLMGMASDSPDEGLINSQFQKLRQYFEQLNSLGFDLDQLSMGMTTDYLIAIKNGATMLRIGSKIFGARSYNHDK